MSSTATPTPSALRSAIRRASRRIVPLVVLMYVVSYLDRVNIGFAALRMNAELGLSTAAYGLGAGLFFVGYVLLEVPSNLVLSRVGARRWLARIMVTWGVVSGAMVFVQNEAAFYVVRVLLGVAEAGFVPGVVFYLTLWFPREVRGRIVAWFLIAIPIAVVVGAPLSSWLISSGDGLFGLSGWRVMFAVEALPAVVVGVVAFFALPDAVRDVTWLTDAERAALTAELEAEADSVAVHGGASVLAALRDWRVYAVSAIGFSANIGGYALSFFLPQVITDFSRQFGQTFSLGEVALLTAIPYGCAAVALWLNGRHSDRTGERTAHIAVPLAVGAVAVAVALHLPSTVAVMVAISVAAAGSYAVIPLFWQLPPRFLVGAGAAAGMGVVGGLANVAGFVAPSVTGALQTATGSFRPGMYLVAAVMVAGAVVAVALGRRPEFRPEPRHGTRAGAAAVAPVDP